MNHGFERAPHGTFTSFDPSGSTSTWPASIKPAGAITGSYLLKGSGAFHGFLRAPDGTITEFDVPGETWTYPTGINPAWAITGYSLGTC